MKPTRLEAIGPRGEACIILRAELDLPDSSKQQRFTLASGEKLRPTDDQRVFETLDGKRRFRLRNLEQAVPGSVISPANSEATAQRALIGSALVQPKLDFR